MTVSELIDLLSEYLESKGDHEVVVCDGSVHYTVTGCAMDSDGETVEISFI